RQFDLLHGAARFHVVSDLHARPAHAVELVLSTVCHREIPLNGGWWSCYAASGLFAGRLVTEIEIAIEFVQNLLIANQHLHELRQLQMPQLDRTLNDIC